MAKDSRNARYIDPIYAFQSVQPRQATELTEIDIRKLWVSWIDPSSLYQSPFLAVILVLSVFLINVGVLCIVEMQSEQY